MTRLLIASVIAISMLSQAADFQNEVITALNLGQWDKIYTLIDEGKINVNTKVIAPPKSEYFNSPLLKVAVKQRNIPAINALLNRGAELNPVNVARSPLKTALEEYLYDLERLGRGDITIIKLLLSKGADPTLKDWHGHDSFDYVRDDLFQVTNLQQQELLDILAKAMSPNTIVPESLSSNESSSIITLPLTAEAAQVLGHSTISLDLNDTEVFTQSSFKELIDDNMGKKNFVIALSQGPGQSWYSHVFDADEFTTYSGTQGNELTNPINRQRIKYLVPASLKKEGNQYVLAE